MIEIAGGILLAFFALGLLGWFFSDPEAFLIVGLWLGLIVVLVGGAVVFVVWLWPHVVRWWPVIVSAIVINFVLGGLSMLLTRLRRKA